MTSAVLASPVHARITQLTPQSIANNEFVSLAFDTAVTQIGGTFWVVGSATRITLPATGAYDVKSTMTFATGAALILHQVGIRKNGDAGEKYFAANSRVSDAAGSVTVLSAHDTMDLIAGDYLEMRAYQNTGGAQLTALWSRDFCAEIVITKLP